MKTLSPFTISYGILTIVEMYKNILESFHYCDENDGINCESLCERLDQKYNYANFVLKNVDYQQTYYYSPSIKHDMSIWKCNGDQYRICVIFKVGDKHKTSV